MEKYEKNPTKAPTESPPAPSHRSSTSSFDLSPHSDKSTHRAIETPENNHNHNNTNNINIINNNNNNNKPSINPQSQSPNRRSSSSSSELSPLSSLGHGSPPRLENPPLQVNRNIREEPPAVKRVNPGGGERRVRQSLSILRAVKRETAVKRAALGFRICGVVFCLISLSVMASDKNRGWALDSFYRYKEFRYCISVNVIGFLYSFAQTCDLAFTICTGKYVLRHKYRFYFDFAMDQILTYLLMSASSSAATRVDDWESNWGKDEFPTMATVSVGLSFMSFIALSASTLISGYALCIWSSS